MGSEIVQMERSQADKLLSNRREKFVELAQKRTVNAIRAIRLIGKLGNRSAYVYTDADVTKIVKAINEETEALKARMKSSKRSDAIEFKL